MCCRRARVFETVAEAVADCSLVVGTTAAQKRELQQPIERVEAGIEAIREHAGRVALMFGSEKFGLSNEDHELCHSLIRIPTDAANAFDESGPGGGGLPLRIQRAVDRPQAAPRAHAMRSKAPTPSRLTKMLLDVLEKSGYTNRITAVSTEQKIRRWVRRMRLSQRDVPLLLGILRQVLWKFEEPPR